jgi:hypothetical protein
VADAAVQQFQTNAAMEKNMLHSSARGKHNET